nr:MAG TPA: intron-associated endonuclease 1 [Caudoviricetes sp.]
MNYRQIYAVKAQNEKRIQKLCPEAESKSGIYCFYRIDENGFKHAYVGQNAKENLLGRLAEHLSGYKQHIDLSIRKYGLYDETKNPYGYKVKVLCYCDADECDEKERLYIKQFHKNGWQLKNVELGGKSGKTDLNERNASRGYHDGLRQGENNARKFIKHLFDLHLDYVPKKQPPSKNAEKAMQKFKDFLESEEENESGID